MTIQTIDELLKHELGIIENMNYPQAFIRTKTIINNTMEHKITNIWNKIKSTRDTFSKIALTKELDELVTKYKNELITKFQREKK